MNQLMIQHLLTETSIKKNPALETLSHNFLEIMNDRGIIASYLLSLLSMATNLENKSQFKVVKDPNSNRVSDLLIHITIPVTLYINLLTFRDTTKKFVLQRDLSKLITNRNYNADHAKLSDKKTMYELANEINFDVKVQAVKV